jgi:hypothetical protein
MKGLQDQITLHVPGGGTAKALMLVLVLLP